MNLIRHCVILFVILTAFSSCNDIEVMRKLDAVDSYINDRPEEALDSLQTISESSLRTRKAKARYALLYSMALDKNYIDTTDISIISKPVNFYKYSFNVNYKFKSFFYFARVCENAGKYDMALEAASKAERMNSRKISPEDRARVQFLKARIYDYSFDLSREITAQKKAAELSRKAGNSYNYDAAKLSLAHTFLARNDIASYERCIKNLNIDSLSQGHKLLYQELKLMSAIEKNLLPGEIKESVSGYLANISDSSDISWNILSRAYFYTGQPQRAKECLKRYKSGKNAFDDEFYQLLASMIYESEGNFEVAYRHLMRYSQISDSLSLLRLRNDTNFIEERYEKELTIQRQKGLIILILIISVLALSYASVKIYNRRKKNIKLRELYENLRKEYQVLKDSNDDNTAKNPIFDIEARKILDNRIQALSAFLSKDVPDSLSSVADKIESLTIDREHLAESIGMLYAIYYPDFINRLRESDLTASEIGFCCLLLLGIKTMDLKHIINKSNTYNISSQIRLKLSMCHEGTKLSIWLKNLFMEFYPEHS